VHYVYIARCADGTLYTGYAVDPTARVAVHNSGRGAHYTKCRLPVTLVYSEVCESKSQALTREHQLKQLTRPQKERLVVSRLASVLIAALLVCGCSAPPPTAAVTSTPGELVDLSHTYDASTIFWPTSETFRLDKVSEGMTPGGYYYAANNVFTAEHGGTHIDAPIHFAQGQETVDQIPLTRLVAPPLRAIAILPTTR
jgi:predicted GIY-YIG superfamily endonuclease